MTRARISFAAGTLAVTGLAAALVALGGCSTPGDMPSAPAKAAAMETFDEAPTVDLAAANLEQLPADDPLAKAAVTDLPDVVIIKLLGLTGKRLFYIAGRAELRQNGNVPAGGVLIGNGSDDDGSFTVYSYRLPRACRRSPPPNVPCARLAAPGFSSRAPETPPTATVDQLNHGSRRFGHA